MGWAVNHLTRGRGHEIITEGVSNVHNSDGEVVVGSDGENQTDRKCC